VDGSHAGVLAQTQPIGKSCSQGNDVRKRSTKLHPINVIYRNNSAVFGLQDGGQQLGMSIIVATDGNLAQLSLSHFHGTMGGHHRVARDTQSLADGVRHKPNLLAPHAHQAFGHGHGKGRLLQISSQYVAVGFDELMGRGKYQDICILGSFQ